MSPAAAAGPERIVIEGAAIATVDAAGTEHASGHVVIEDGRIVAVGPGPAPAGPNLGPADPSPRPAGSRPTRRVDGSGCLVTPGLVNTHHHLYQWASRGMAQQATLFEWLVELYPVWARLNAEITHAAATAGLAWLARTGCTTAADHHYIFPGGYGGSSPRAGIGPGGSGGSTPLAGAGPSDAGDLFAATIEAAGRVGLRFHPARGSMDRGRSAGGLPPDEVVEDLDAALAATEEAIARHHDPAFDAMVRVAVAPCSPFSVSADLMTGAAELARRHGVRLHTHLAETLDEEEHCRAQFGRTPAEYLDDLGWLGDDVWLAHCVHLSGDAVKRFAATGTGVAHCPSSNARLGAGISPVADLLDAGAPVGLGVDGAASNEAGGLGEELRQALLLARLRGGPTALTARQALALGTIGGARCLGRADEIGSLEPGKLADLVVWRLDGLAHAGINDPVAALVLGSLPPIELSLVGGRPVVERDEMVGVDADAVASDLRVAARRLVGDPGGADSVPGKALP
ncbi:MAG: amidohydrolase family protein [Micromonosporaceae bacterium]|nr:amidohydrolase family protein [Micromonosporaceae bacterium]